MDSGRAIGAILACDRHWKERIRRRIAFWTSSVERTLPIQDLIESGIVKLHKIHGERNPSDVFTKFVKLEVLLRHLKAIGLFNRMEDLFIGSLFIRQCDDEKFIDTDTFTGVYLCVIVFIILYVFIAACIFVVLYEFSSAYV